MGIVPGEEEEEETISGQVLLCDHLLPELYMVSTKGATFCFYNEILETLQVIQNSTSIPSRGNIHPDLTNSHWALLHISSWPHWAPHFQTLTRHELDNKLHWASPDPKA